MIVRVSLLVPARVMVSSWLPRLDHLRRAVPAAMGVAVNVSAVTVKDLEAGLSHVGRGRDAVEGTIKPRLWTSVRSRGIR